MDGKLQETPTSVIIYNGDSEAPIVHLHRETKFQKIALNQYRRGFWLFNLEGNFPGNSIDLCISQKKGPSKSFIIPFSSIKSNFTFLNIKNGEGLMSFAEFHAFFNSAISNRKINFSFDSNDQLSDIDCFLSSFNEGYLVYALIFISCQPWYSLFHFNEGLSGILFKYLKNILFLYFFKRKTELETPNFKKFSCQTDICVIKPRFISAPELFSSCEAFVDTFFAFVREQLGSGFAFLVSTIFTSINAIHQIMNDDNHNDFQLFDSAPPLTYENSTHIDSIFSDLFAIAQTEKDFEFLYFTWLSVCTPSTKFQFKLPNFVNPSLEIVTNIIKARLLVSEVSLENLQNGLFSKIQNLDELTDQISNNDCFIPFEWLDSIKSALNITDELTFSAIIHNSLKMSISKHFLPYFANVSPNGALFYGNIDITNKVLQPGSILQENVDCGKCSMMMAGSVALSGSILSPNCYAPRNAVVLPLSGKKPIDPEAELQFPVELKKGITVGPHTFISKNVSVGSGTKIGANVFIGENVVIHKGCTIDDDEIIPNNFVIPTGFKYNQSVVEFSKSIPKVIEKSQTAFFKRLNGFVDLSMIIKTARHLIVNFLEKLSAFPAECGRQFAQNCDLLEFSEDFADSLYYIFGIHSLLFALEFWNEKKKSDKNLDISTESKLDTIILDISIKSFQNINQLTVDDFEEDMNSLFVLAVAQNFDIFKEKGVPPELIANAKKFIFELVDEVIVRLSVFRQQEKKKMVQTLHLIIDLTHEKLG
ncbi:hypothetical protein TRFO_02859 [Tritrichomonas foetus]|uniref:Uncharacterized protein n=1 Tax=Tritrichomonas foetus TaxID=1144522 RepID=A0A1J4KW31_9EUKA|nr:hypothetical protein TRFO_02859 [Tritrichomonas foetus]|eukprot:OHT15529.1 hypothetical protein TRFO_02859 [Tritrichomonas foetus]